MGNGQYPWQGDFTVLCLSRNNETQSLIAGVALLEMHSLPVCSWDCTGWLHAVAWQLCRFLKRSGALHVALSGTGPEKEESNGSEVQRADITARSTYCFLHHKALSADQLSEPAWHSITCFLIGTCAKDMVVMQDEARILVQTCHDAGLDRG